MASRLSGQTSIFGGVFYVSKSLLGMKKLKTILANFDPKVSDSCWNIDMSNVAYWLS